MCPKECVILHYEASMSYAAANQNSENRYNLSERYRERTRKQLNDSLDIMENILSDRRRTNADDFQRLFGFFEYTTIMISSKYGLLSNQVQYKAMVSLQILSTTLKNL